MTERHKTTRREFLGAGSAAVAGAVLMSAAQPEVKGRDAAPRVRFGVRTPLPKITFREKALLVKRLGFDGIEIGQEMTLTPDSKEQWLNQSVEAIKKEIAGIDIAISAIVGSIELLNTNPEARAKGIELDRHRLQMAKELGASGVIEVPTFGPNLFQDLSPLLTPRQIEEQLLIAGLKQLAPDTARTGVPILLEALTKKETHFINRQDQMVDIIKAVGQPGFNLLSDFYHMQLEEKDIGETLTRDGKYTRYVHLADGEKRTEPGSLPFDYRPGFKALKKWGFSGWLTMEFRAKENQEEATLARGLKYIKQQWSEA
jgi:sugar phosphate isomerase/epimerase